MRVLWTHNFDPAIPNSGLFVHSMADAVRACGVDLQLEYLGNLRSVPRLLRARRHASRLALDFDLVHAQYGSACAWATAAVTAVPKVLTIRGSDWNVHTSSLGFMYLHARIASGLSRSSIGSYDCVLPVSRRLATDLAGFVADDRISVLPSPIDLSRFVPLDRREAKALLGYPNCREKWVLFNSLDLNNPVKRYRLAMQAFEIASARHGNLRLRLATDLPHDKLPEFVAACDVILCASTSEGWPNSIKEALACNVPFVSTDVSDLNEIAQQESTCRICPPDPQIIADNICEVLAESEPKDLRCYVQGMSLNATSERLVSIYDSVLSSRRGAEEFRG